MNRQQVQFHNRYCDEPPLRDESATNQNKRINEKSRGKIGEKRKLREETEREDDSRSRETTNEFADAVEAALLSKKANKLKRDEEKEAIMASLNSELEKAREESNTNKANLMEVNQRIDVLASEFDAITSKINETNKKKLEIERKIDEINRMLSGEERALADVASQQLANVDEYINKMNKKLSTEVQIELIKVKEECKTEIKEELKQLWLSIKSELENETQSLMGEKVSLEKVISSKKREKSEKEEEIEVLRNQELSSLMNRVKNENELAAADALQKKLQREKQNEEEQKTKEEVMITEEFKMSDNKTSKLKAEIKEDLSIRIEQLVITDDRYKRILNKAARAQLAINNYPSIKDLIECQLKYATKYSMDKNVLLGYLDFIIHAYSLGIYDKLFSKSHLIDKNDLEMLHVKELMQSIYAKPGTLEKLYGKIAEFYFKTGWTTVVKSTFNQEITIDNFLCACSLQLHYKAATKETETIETSELENKMIVFVSKGGKAFSGKENLIQVQHLIKDYKLLVDAIGRSEYPAVAIVYGNLNRFYDFIIKSLRHRLDVDIENEKYLLLWKDIDEILALAELLQLQLKEINKSELWKDLTIVNNEEELASCFPIKFIKEKKAKIDDLRARRVIEIGRGIGKKEFGISKIELIEEYLQPMLIEVLVRKQNENEYNKLERQIFESNVFNSKEKEEFIFELKQITSKNKTIGVCKQSFVSKYKHKLELKDSTEASFSFCTCLDRIIKVASSEVAAEGGDNYAIGMLRDYVYLFERNKTWSYDELSSIFRKLSDSKLKRLVEKEGISNLLNKLEYLISRNCEEVIKARLSDQKIKDFDAVFEGVLQERTKVVKGEFTEIVSRKNAFYDQVNELVNKNNKPINDKDAIRRATFIIGFSHGGMGKDPNCRALTKDEISVLESIQSGGEIKQDHQLVPSEIYEDIIFKLSELRYDIMMASRELSLTAVEANKDKIMSKFKNIEGDFQTKRNKIKEIKSDNVLIQGLKTYITVLDRNILIQEKAQNLAKVIKKSEEMQFIQKVKETKEELRNGDIDVRILDEKMVEVVDNSFKTKFVATDSWKEKNEFLLTVLKLYDDTQHNVEVESSGHGYFFKLIDLLEFNELLSKEYFIESIQYLAIIESLKGLDKKEKNKLRESVNEKFKEYGQSLISSAKLFLEKSKDSKSVILALNQIISVAEPTLDGVKLTCELFEFIEILNFERKKQINERKMKIENTEAKKDEMEIGVDDAKKEEKMAEVEKFDIMDENERHQFINDQFVENVMGAFEGSLKKQIKLFKSSKVDEDDDFGFYKILKFLKVEINKEALGTKSRILNDFIPLFELKLNVKMKDDTKNVNKEYIEKEIAEMVRNYENAINRDKLASTLKCIEKLIEIVNNSYLNEVIESVVDLRGHINRTMDECSVIRESILEVYKRKLDTRHELTKKSRINFIQLLISQLHNNKIIESVSILPEFYNGLAKAIGEKESSKEIESYLVDQVNSTAFVRVIQIMSHYDHVDVLKAYKDCLVTNVNIKSVLTILFGDTESANDDGDKCLFTDLIRMINIMNKSKQKSETTIVNYMKLISQLLNEVYFDSGQDEIEEMRKELLSVTDPIIDPKSFSKEFWDLIKTLNNLLIKACYRKNNFLKYVDLRSICFNSIEIKNEVNILLKASERLLWDISLINRIDNGCKSSSKLMRSPCIRLIKEQIAVAAETDTTTKLNELNLKEKIKDAIKCIEEYQDDGGLLKQVADERKEILNILSSNDDKEFSKLKFKALKVLTKDKVNYYERNYSSKCELFLNLHLDKSNEANRSVLAHLTSIYNYIINVEDSYERLYLYLFYANQFKDIEKTNSTKLDMIGLKLLVELYNIQIDSKYITNSLKRIKSEKLSNTDLEVIERSLRYALAFLSTSTGSVGDIKKIIEIICWNKMNADNNNQQLKGYLSLNLQLIKCFHANNDYHKSTLSLMSRLIDLIERKTVKANQLELSVDIDDLKNVCKHLIEIQSTVEHKEVMKRLLTQFKYDWLVNNILTDTEASLVRYLNATRVRDIMVDKISHLWEDEFEDEYLVSISESVLDEEKRILMGKLSAYKNVERFESELNSLIKSTYFDTCKKATNEVKIHVADGGGIEKIDEINENLELVDSIKVFKESLFVVKEVQNSNGGESSLKWVQLFKSIEKRKSEGKIKLKNAIEILTYSRLFDDVDELTKILNSDELDLPRQVLLTSLGCILVKLFNISERFEVFNTILEKLIKILKSDGDRYLRLLIEKVHSDLEHDMKYERSEVESMKRIIDMSLTLGLYQEEKRDVLNRLERLSILKWDKILKSEMIKYELNRDDDELVNDLLYIEKYRGQAITNRLVDIFKNTQINDLLMKYIIRKFRKNEWELSNQVLDLLEATKNKDTSQWTRVIEEYDEKEKRKELSVSELVLEMKRLEGMDEINSSIKELIKRPNGEQSVIEVCLDELIAKYNQSSTETDIASTKICDYNEADVKEWARKYKKLSKKNAKTINCSIILELVAVVSRASQIVYEHELRSTQKIALLVFIDSIINN